MIIYDLLNQKPFWDRAEQRQFFLLELHLSIKLDKTCVIADVGLLALNPNWLSWSKF